MVARMFSLCECVGRLARIFHGMSVVVRGQPAGLVHLFYHVNSRDRTQVVRFGSKLATEPSCWSHVSFSLLRQMFSTSEPYTVLGK